MADPNPNIDTKVVKDLRDLFKDLAILQGDFKDRVRESILDLNKVAKATESINAKIKATSTSELDLRQINADILKSKREQAKAQNILAEVDQKYQDSAKKKYNNITEYLKKIEKKQSEINVARASGANAEYVEYNKQLLLLESNLQKESLGVDTLEAKAIAAMKINETYADTIKALEAQKVLAEAFNKKMGVTGALFKKLGLDVSIGTKAFADMVKEFDAGSSKTKIFLTGLKSAVKEGLEDPLISVGMVAKANNAIFNGIKSAFSFVKNIAEKVLSIITGWDSKVFEFGKNLGIGEKESRAMMGHFLDMSSNSGNLFLNTKGISETFTQMSDSLGFMAPKNEEMLQTATLLQRQFGLSAEQLQSITENSALSGQTFKDTFDTINGIRMAEGAANKLVMNQKQMMADISKVSSLVLLNFKGNVPALASAVVTAKKLGMSLNDVAATTNGYLDFESSISKEFEAQLLTGKDLNLQKLRYLALTHDTKGMMDEIGKRIPSMLEFEHMNTIERQSYAEAMNMSEEGMAEIIKRQEVARKLGIDQNTEANQMYDALVKLNLTHDQIVDKMKEAGAQQYLTASINDRFSSALENIKDLFGQMMQGELGTMINGFLSMLTNTQEIHKWLDRVKGIASGIAKFFSDLPASLKAVLYTVSALMAAAAVLETGIGIAMVATGNEIGGAAMILGGLKLGAGAAAAGYAGHEIGGMSVGQSALNNQVGAPAAATGAGTAAAGQAGSQPVNVNVLVQNSYDGEKAAPINAKYQQWAITDNKGGNLSPSHNTANSGQTH